MAKTIKEIADELGVSKTAVSKQIANLGLRSSLRKNGNQFAIENQQEKLIKMAFRKNKQRERVVKNLVSDEQSQTENHEVCDLVCVLQTTVDTLQEQLSVKDQQIRELNARLAECSTALLAAQETARAAQALHAGTIQQQLSDGEDYAASVPDEQAAPNNRRWFSRFFRR